MKRRDMSTLSLVTQLGVTVVTALVLSLLLGLWLDSRLGTRPLLTLTFSLFGILIGTVGVYRLVTRAIADSVAEYPRTKSSPKASGSGDAGETDPWTDEDAENDAEKDDWDRDPWKDDDAAAEKRRARQEEAERRLGLQPPKVKRGKPEEEQK